MNATSAQQTRPTTTNVVDQLQSPFSVRMIPVTRTTSDAGMNTFGPTKAMSCPKAALCAGLPERAASSPKI